MTHTWRFVLAWTARQIRQNAAKEKAQTKADAEAHVIQVTIGPPSPGFYDGDGEVRMMSEAEVKQAYDRHNLQEATKRKAEEKAEIAAALLQVGAAANLQDDDADADDDDDNPPAKSKRGKKGAKATRKPRSTSKTPKAPTAKPPAKKPPRAKPHDCQRVGEVTEAVSHTFSRLLDLQIDLCQVECTKVTFWWKCIIQ